MSNIELSVILVSREPFSALATVVRHLRAQTARGRFELVVVTPSKAYLAADEVALAEIGPYQIVECAQGWSVGRAMAAGVVAARALLVAFAEDHVYPEPGWVEAVLARFVGPWAAVGWALANANPGSVSAAALMLDFGPWVEPVTGGEMTRLATHNAAYRRDVVLAYGLALGDWMESEVVLQRDLHARGYRFYLEPQARVQHENLGYFSLLVRQQYWGGRVYGGSRARVGKWLLWRRWLYIAGAPFIPWLRLARLAQTRRGRGWGGATWRVLPPLVVGLVTHTLGEVVGYALGMGDSLTAVSNVYHDRMLDIVRRDLKRQVTSVVAHENPARS